jgi:hypothetical protein
MISWLIRLVSKKAREKHRHNVITTNYKELASTIGEAITQMMLGEPVITFGVTGESFSLYDPELYRVLDTLEVAYSTLGYRIIPMGDWIDYGGWAVPIDELWLVKRDEGERPQFSRMIPPPQPPGPGILQRVMESERAIEAYEDDHGELHIEELED